MGKSKRIRSDRARQYVDNPASAKTKSAKSAKLTSVILILVIVAILAVTIVLVALNKSGTILRANVAYRSDNYQIDSAMLTYMYYSTYNYYYSYYGSTYISYFTSSIISSTKSSAEKMLVTCEAAKAEGITLTEIDRRMLEKQIESIKTSAKENKVSISQIYGNKGITENDIRRVMELELIRSRYEAIKQDGLTETISKDEERLNKYLENNKNTLITGGIIKASASLAEWQDALKAAKTAEEFKAVFVKLYTEANFVSSFNSSAAVPSAALAEVLKKVVADEMKAELLNTAIDGVTFGEKDERSTKLTTIFTKVYQEKFTANAKELGMTAPTSTMYTAIATAIGSKITSAKLTNASTAAQLETAANEIIDGLYKDKIAALPTPALLNSFINAVIDDIKCDAYAIEIKDLEFKDDESTASRIQKIYEAKYKSAYTPVEGESGVSEVKAAVYTLIAAADDAITKNIASALTINASYGFPKESDTTTGTGTTTAAPSSETTGAGTTAATETETTPTDSQTDGETTDESGLSGFDAWFFGTDKRAENDIYTDKSYVYFVTDPAELNETITKNVAHILVSVDAETAADNATDAEKKAIEEANEKKYAEALTKAQALLDEFLKGDKTKESFEALANKNTDDSGIFYYNVKKDAMVTEFNDWIYDDSRVAGDTGIVKTKYGQHIMLFIGDGLKTWQSTSVSALVTEDYNTAYETLKTTHKVTSSAAALTSVFGS